MAYPVVSQPEVQLTPGEITIGLLADTHIPDRVSQIHPEVANIFQHAGVSHILHAGDISAGWVLKELRALAPVTAVRGNRDFGAGRLRPVEILSYGNVNVALMHGHGGLVSYFVDKVRYTFEGYRLERYLDLLVKAAGDAQVVVFGHTHRPVIHAHRGKLVINPGSASFGLRPGGLPTLGLLRISPGGEVSPEIMPLRGWEIHKRKWQILDGS